MKKVIVFALSLFLFQAVAFAQIKVACIGNSITFGSTIANRATQSYPAQLDSILGENWEVGNFGVSGATLLKKANKPYVVQPAFADAKNFNPDIVVIKLGTNDSKTANWVFKADFEADYKALIDEFKTLPKSPKIFICLPVPATTSRFTINDTVISTETIPLVTKIAKDNDVFLIDLNRPFQGHTEWYHADGIHPNAQGAKRIAELVSMALLNHQKSCSR